MLTKYWHKETSVDDTAFCAGGEAGKDSCTGDAGAPLFCLNSSTQKYEATGLVSWGSSVCGQANLPSSYTDVARYSNWLSSLMKQRNIY